MSRPAGRAYLVAYDLDATTERGRVECSGLTWTDDLGADGVLRASVPLLQPALVDAPDLLADAVLKVELDPTGDGDLVPLAGYLYEPGPGTLVGDGHDAARVEQLTCPPLASVLDGVDVYHDGGLNPYGGDQRYLGWMSLDYPATGWTTPLASPWATDPTARGLSAGGPYPVVFADLDPAVAWIAATSPTVTVPVGTRHLLRGTFTLAETGPVQVVAAADNTFTLYLDGDRIYSKTQAPFGWRQEEEPYVTILQAGTHVVAVAVENGALDGGGPNPLGFVCNVSTLDDTGLPEATVLRSGTSGWVATDDTDQGYSAAGIFLRLVGEAVDRGHAGAARLDLTFTGSTSSPPESEAWTDVQEEAFRIGASVGEQVDGKFNGQVYDRDVAHDWTTSLYRSQGQDRTGTVTLGVGVDVASYTWRPRPVIATRLLLRSAERYDLVTRPVVEAAGVDTREAFLETGQSLTAAQALAYGGRYLDDYARTRYDYTAVVVVVPDEGGVYGPVPGVDYRKGDVILAPDRRGDLAPLKVVSIGGTDPDDGSGVRFILELTEAI